MQPTIMGLCFYVMFLFSAPIYLLILATIVRFRKKKPFCENFFTISLSIGIFDMLHLIPGWLLGRFANYGWFGIHEVVLSSPAFWAKFESMVWWFAGLGQTMGVPLFAAARMLSVTYGYELSPNTVRLMILLHWVVPALITIPQLTLQFDYYIHNHTDGTIGVSMVWNELEYKNYYFSGCVWWCGTMALLSGICFAVTFHSVYTNRGRIRPQMKGSTAIAEIKLALVGTVLFVLTAIYAVYCAANATMTRDDAQLLMLEMQFALGDTYSWINAYLLLLCSAATRRYAIALLFCSTPEGCLRGGGTTVTRNSRPPEDCGDKEAADEGDNNKKKSAMADGISTTPRVLTVMPIIEMTSRIP